MKLTSAQQVCVDVTDRNLIVSAGAGAGKTATLIERVFGMLSRDESPCGVDDLLIVTFTRAAAEEMRGRLARRLRAETQREDIDAAKREHLEEQLFLLPRAQISTIHSFCLSIITSYPEEAGLAPGFDLMSEEEARLFRRDFFREKVESALEGEDEMAAALRRLAEESDPVYALPAILEVLMRFHDFLGALPDPMAFVERALGVFADCGESGPPQDSAAWFLVDMYIRESVEPMRTLMRAALSADPNRLAAKMQPQWMHLRSMYNDLQAWIDGGMALSAMEGLLNKLQFDRLSSRREPLSDLDERFKSQREALMKLFKSARERLTPYFPENLSGEFAAGENLVRSLLRVGGIEWGAELFERHIEVRRLTFAHLERLALRILRDKHGEPTEVSRILRDRFRYILVDEFQDVNEVQELIVKSLCRSAEDGGQGNLFVVGDVKQSIYEFRLADPTLFLRTYNGADVYTEHMPDGRPARINLGANFRSAHPLLDEFNRIFAMILREETIGIEYSPDHEFTAGRSEAVSGKHAPRYSIHVLAKELNEAANADEDAAGEDLSAEAQYVADLVAGIGPPWKDICILLRAASGTATELVEALSRRDVPTFTDSRLGFLAAVEVLEFQSLLRTINNPYDEISLLAVLRGPAARWNEEELLALRAVDRHGSYVEILRRCAEADGHPLQKKSARFLEDLDRWQKLGTRNSMADFFAILFDELHLIDRAAARPGGDQRRLNLLFLHERARQFDRFLTKGLGAFLEFLDDLIENDEDFSPPSPLPENADVVRVMTMHKSKGMQFPVVVCPFLGRQFNEFGLREKFLLDREAGVASVLRDMKWPTDQKPPYYLAMQNYRRRKERGEELRLFYVAQTRAEEALYLIGSASKAAERFQDARDAAFEDLPDPVDVLSVRSSLEWILAFAARRFKQFERNDGVISAQDGIAEFRLIEEATIEPVADTVREEEVGRVDDGLLRRFESAARRIEALASKPPEPQFRAKISVTEAKRAFDALREPQTPPFRIATERPAGTDWSWMPASLGGAERRKGAERGQAVHRFLALCDLEGLSRGQRKLGDERDRLVEDGLLTPEQAALVNLYDLQWFLNSDLGKRVRGAVSGLMREKAFTVRIDGDELATMPVSDTLILQGVVDLLFEEPRGWIIIDYKTDFCGVNGERVEELARGYASQVQLYRLAVERTLGPPVAEAWLVFLGARQTVAIDAAAAESVDWNEVVEAGAVIYPDVEHRPPNPRDV